MTRRLQDMSNQSINQSKKLQWYTVLM